MDLYLPIAGVSVNAITIAMFSMAVGFISGLLGIGGGFLMTPLLVFSGIPPTVSAATATCHIMSAASTGVVNAGRRSLDGKMASVLAFGGLIGVVIGVEAIKWLSGFGLADIIVTLTYVLFLSTIGITMTWESAGALRRMHQGLPPKVLPKRTWAHHIPGRMRFRTSRLYISPLPPAGLGFLTGILAALMGVGGGFILAPAMIYMLRMPGRVITATSQLQIMLIAGITAMMHAGRNQTLDLLLAVILMVGGAIGAQIGARFAIRARAEVLRFALAAIVLLAAARLTWGMALPPEDAFSLVLGVGE